MSTLAETTRQQAERLVPKATSYVDGTAIEGSAAVREYVHPGDGRGYAAPTLAGPAELDAAVAAAAREFHCWRAVAPSARRDLLLRCADAIRCNSVDLAALVSLEMGMPLRAAVAGVELAAEWFAYYGGWADKIYGVTAPVAAPGSVHDYTVLGPRGVVGAVIPWNGPVTALALKVAPALAAGNCVVLKPSELAPFSSVHLVRLLVEAGLPAGVLGVVGGGPEIGAALVAHTDVDMVSFTGGCAAGQAVGAAASARGIPAVLELGGKSASLVFDDVDPARAGKLGALLGIAQNSGQGCFLPTRMLVHRRIYHDVVEAVVGATGRIRLGDPFAPGTSMGPVAGDAAAERILGVIEAAVRERHGRLIAGGRRAGGDLANGSFVEPTAFADVDPLSPLAQEEIFGPVLSIIPVDDEEEAIGLANDTRFGLAGYVWTSDLARAHRVAGRLDAGYVSVNGMAGLPPSAPFGGWKASGHGTEGGPDGIREYLRTKNVHVQL